MTPEELGLLVQQQQEQIDRLSKVVDRLYQASNLPNRDREQKMLDEVEANATALSNELAQLLVKAEAGDALAQFSLGWTHYYAKGVSENSVEGVKWWTLSAHQGYAEAQWELGGAYATGRGVTQDLVAAYAWYNIAAENGFIYAKKDKEKIAKSMYAGQVIRAEEMAKKFSNKIPVADKMG
jgi:TPR repeat protein